MVRKYGSMFQFFAQYCSDRIHGLPPRGGIGIIGGSDGPTAIYVARGRRPRRDDGCMLVRPKLTEVLIALSMAAGLVTLGFAVFRAMTRSFGRYR